MGYRKYGLLPPEDMCGHGKDRMFCTRCAVGDVAVNKDHSTGTCVQEKYTEEYYKDIEKLKETRSEASKKAWATRRTKKDTSGPLKITNVVSHALDMHSKEIADAVISNSLVSAWLKASSKLKVDNGGKTFHDKCVYDAVGGFDWIKAGTSVPTATPTQSGPIKWRKMTWLDTLWRKILRFFKK